MFLFFREINVNGNGLIVWLLRSRWHGLLSGNTLLITVTGRKSGRQITLPVNFIRNGSELWIVSSRDRTWWKNVIGGAPVILRLQGRDVPARAEAALDEAQVAAMLRTYLGAFPMAAKAMGVKKDGNLWDAHDLAQAARSRVAIRVML